MSKKNWLILSALVVVIVAVALLSWLLPKAPRTIDENAPTLATETPAVTDAPVTVTTPAGEIITPSPVPETTNAPETENADARAYLVVTVAGKMYQPIPLTQEGEYAINQKSNTVKNVVHVTPDSVYMATSTCDNQLCVEQGTVSLENIKERVLGNMIVCLPNQVTLELYTPQELLQLIKGN